MKRFAIATVALATAAIAAGCGGIEIDDDDMQPAGAVVVRSDRIVEEQYSGIEERRRQVIRDRASWRAFWNEVHEDREMRPQAPAIDFDESMVIVAAMGRRPTGGHEIEIPEVYRTTAGLTAVVIETEPAEDCVLAQALTAPVYAVRVPASDQPVQFTERRRVREC